MLPEWMLLCGFWWVGVLALVGSVRFKAGDKVKWYGHAAEIVAVRGDRVWVHAGKLDVVTSAVELVEHQRVEVVRT